MVAHRPIQVNVEIVLSPLLGCMFIGPRNLRKISFPTEKVVGAAARHGRRGSA